MDQSLAPEVGPAQETLTNGLLVASDQNTHAG